MTIEGVKYRIRKVILNNEDEYFILEYEDGVLFFKWWHYATKNSYEGREWRYNTLEEAKNDFERIKGERIKKEEYIY